MQISTDLPEGVLEVFFNPRHQVQNKLDARRQRRVLIFFQF